VNETRMDKEAGRGPKEFNSGALLFFFQDLNDLIEIAVRFCEAGPFRCDVPIVKGVKGRTEFFNELKGHVRPTPGVLNGRRTIVPRAESCSDPKRVTQRVTESVPVGHGKAKMIGHGPTFDDFGGIVMFESERVLGGTTFVRDFIDIWKGGFHKCIAVILKGDSSGFHSSRKKLT
jgi:hypothetical protein